MEDEIQPVMTALKRRHDNSNIAIEAINIYTNIFMSSFLKLLRVMSVLLYILYTLAVIAVKSKLQTATS